MIKRKTYFFLTLLFLTLILQNVEAGPSCSKAKKIKKVDISKSLGPIRDQDGTGWCYAFAGADIIGHRLMERDPNYKIEGRKDQISAVAIALNYNRDNRLSRYYDFERKVKISAKLSADPQYKQKLEKKLKDQREKRDQWTEKLISKKTSLAKKYQKYRSALHRCEKEGKTDLCSYMGKIIEIKMEIENYLSNDMDYIDHEIEIEKINIELAEIREWEAAGGNTPYFEEENGGYTAQALRNLQGGLCQENDIPSDDFQYSKQFIELVKNSSSERAEIFRNIAKMNKLLYAGMRRISVTASDPSMDVCITARIGKMIFPQIDVKDIARVLKKGFSAEYDPLDELYKMSCTKNNKLKNLGPVVEKDITNTSNKEEMFDEIDRTLNSGRPLVIEYQPEIYDFGGDLLSKEIEASTSGHASVIVGKSYNCQTGEMEYKIRNSWGADACEQGRADFKTDDSVKKEIAIDLELQECEVKCDKIPETQEEAYDDCLTRCSDQEMKKRDTLEKQVIHNIPYRCEDGHYVVSKSLLKQGVFGVVHY